MQRLSATASLRRRLPTGTAEQGLCLLGKPVIDFLHMDYSSSYTDLVSCARYPRNVAKVFYFLGQEYLSIQE